MRILYFIVSIAILASGVIAFAYNQTGAKEAEQANCLYVSPDGNDQNDGTKEKPFRTLAHAANQAVLKHNRADSGRYV